MACRKAQLQWSAGCDAGTSCARGSCHAVLDPGGGAMPWMQASRLAGPMHACVEASCMDECMHFRTVRDLNGSLSIQSCRQASTGQWVASVCTRHVLEVNVQPRTKVAVLHVYYSP